MALSFLTDATREGLTGFTGQKFTGASVGNVLPGALAQPPAESVFSTTNIAKILGGTLAAAAPYLGAGAGKPPNPAQSGAVPSTNSLQQPLPTPALTTALRGPDPTQPQADFPSGSALFLLAGVAVLAYFICK